MNKKINNTIDKFKKDINNEMQVVHLATDNVGLPVNCLNTKPINVWMDEAKNRPIPNKLFSELWHEHELCILYSDSNLGKSILAVQIGNSISKGVPIYGFKLETEPLKVLLFDFELSDKQLENRYSKNYQDHYIFNENFLRAEINPEQNTPDKFKSYEDFLRYSIEENIIKNEVRILIIDNLTYLSNDTEKSKDALGLMKMLNQLKNKHNLSILVLAHTPKRDKSKPLSKNDLSGSRALMNFCDSAFAIGESSTEVGLRYIKQIKQRNTEQIYHEGNVIVCRVEKPDNFIRFVFIEYGDEYEHLQPKITDVAERTNKIIELNQQGLNNSEIGRQLKISEGTVRNTLSK